MEDNDFIKRIKRKAGPEKLEVLDKIFELSETPDGIDKTDFRVDHRDWIPVLDTLEDSQFLLRRENKDQNYRVTGYALPLLKNSHANELLRLMEKCYEFCKHHYETNKGRTALDAWQLNKELIINKELLAEVLVYMSDIHSWGNIVGDQSSESTQIYVRETTLTKETLKQIIYETLSLHFFNEAYIFKKHRPEKERELCLIGTWSGEEKDLFDLGKRISHNGKSAIWWSFVINEDAQKKLEYPFFLYINFKSNTIKFKLRVIEFSTKPGNSGHISPWPKFTPSEEIGLTKSDGEKNYIFKTWLLIDQVFQLKESLTVENFEPEATLSNKDNILNQNRFGYAYLKPGHSTATEILISPSQLTKKHGYVVAEIDNPTKTDSLGRDRLASALASMLSAKEQQSPFTFAILGEWGTGKSTLIQMISDKIIKNNRDSFEICNFNAWAFEACPNIAAALAQEIIAGLIKNMPFHKKLWLSLCFAYHNRKEDLGWITVFVAASTISVITAVIKWPDKIPQFLSLGLPAFIIILFAYYKVFTFIVEHPFTTHFRNFITLPKFKHHLGITSEIRETISLFCKLVLNNGGADSGTLFFRKVFSRKAQETEKRLIIFIDDLDRCRPAQILNVLEAVGLVTNIENVFVVLAIDPRILIESAKYFQREANKNPNLDTDVIARDYLSKIFQLVVSLDEPEDENIRSFIYNRFFNNTNNFEINNDGSQEENNIVTDNQMSNKDHHNITEINADIPATNVALESTAEPEVNSALLENTRNEMKCFIENSELFSIKNPRQLIRLHNSYNLIKILSPDSYYSDEGDSLMKVLFLREFLEGLKTNEKKKIEEFILGKGSELKLSTFSYEFIEFIGHSINESFNNFIEHSDHKRYLELSRFVNRFIIPSIDTESST